jgi:hypothetical protein
LALGQQKEKDVLIGEGVITCYELYTYNLSGENLLKRQAKIGSIPKIGISLAVREEQKHQVAMKVNTEYSYEEALVCCLPENITLFS